MHRLSKSRLLAFRQCPKRLWLEVHRPELREDSDAAQAAFDAGHKVGEIARSLYDPDGIGALVDAQREGFETAFARSAELLASSRPIFEAGFVAGGALAFADVMLPVSKAGNQAWRIIEVKSSTSVKDYHRDDAAIQAFVARAAGVPLDSIALAHIDSQWVYPGDGNYAGLLTEVDLTAEAFNRDHEVEAWIGSAQAVVAGPGAPSIATGRHCRRPFECGFFGHCANGEAKAKHPVTWLPRVASKPLRALLEGGTVTEMEEVPDELLNQCQLRVKAHTLSGQAYFDAPGAQQDLAPYKLPAYFLDFETVAFPIPLWKGTRPYQHNPFQFSLHRLSQCGELEHREFIDVSGSDPSIAFAVALIDACGDSGPVFAYNAVFETSRLNELAVRFPHLRQPLLAVVERVVDLLRIAERRYYHPGQQGSWSIKRVLPTIAPHLQYAALEGVQDGGMAMNAYREAITPSTTGERRDAIVVQLRKYCGLDTIALVELWRHFAGRADVVI